MTQPAAAPHPRDGASRFQWDHVDVDDDQGRLVMHWRVDESPFEEVLEFGAEIGAGWRDLPEDTFLRAVDDLHLIAGVSYFKAACPPVLTHPRITLTQDQAMFWTQTYRLGLGEFLFQNKLPFSRIPSFSASGQSTESIQAACRGGAPQCAGTKRALVMLGGGKDSVVAARMLQEAGIEFDFFSLGDHPLYGQVTKDLGVDRRMVVRRKLDPRILAWNREGYYNGHVPFSAYLAFVGMLLARGQGYRWVICANESSANEGNVWYDGVEINHQYSKSFAFEQAFQAYIQTRPGVAPWYCSMLRPLSEPEITEVFARIGTPAFESFSSCNRNFTQVYDPARPRWCGTCPKCLGTTILLAPHLDTDTRCRIFGADLLERPDLYPLMRDLVGLGEAKPFECVATYDDHVRCCEAVAFAAGADTPQRWPTLLRLLHAERPLSPRPLPVWHLSEVLRRPHALPADLQAAYEDCRYGTR